jgi:hypothetical protein
MNEPALSALLASGNGKVLLFVASMLIFEALERLRRAA